MNNGNQNSFAKPKLNFIIHSRNGRFHGNTDTLVDGKFRKLFTCAVIYCSPSCLLSILLDRGASGIRVAWKNCSKSQPYKWKALLCSQIVDATIDYVAPVLSQYKFKAF